MQILFELINNSSKIFLLKTRGNSLYKQNLLVQINFCLLILQEPVLYA